MLVQNLDEEPAVGAEVERPGPMEFLGRLRLEPCGLEPLVDFVHPLRTVLHEADVESAGVFDVVCLVEVVQGQDESRPVGQDGKGVAAALRDAPEAEVRVSQISRRIGSGPGGEFPPGESLVIRCGKPESPAEVRLNPRG